MSQRAVDRRDANHNGADGKQKVGHRSKDNEMQWQLSLAILDDRSNGEQSKHMNQRQLYLRRAGRRTDDAFARGWRLDFNNCLITLVGLS